MNVAIAACLIELPAAAKADVHLLPAGTFRAADGRPADAPHWMLPPAAAAALSERLAARKTARVIDYEHQTLHAERNGQPAPAAGWFRRVELRENGLHAVGVEWTARAKALIDAGEYRYISPVFTYRPGSGEILDVLHAGLTNTPALDELSAVAARFFSPSLPEDFFMPIPASVCSALGLANGADEPAVVAAIATLKTAAPDPAQYAPVAALKAAQDELAALKAADPKPAAPDPAQYAPVAALKAVQDELAALKAGIAAAELDGAIKAALKDGRLLPALESWARELGGKDLPALRAYLAAAQPIAALVGMQSAGKTPPTAPISLNRAAFDRLTPRQARDHLAAGGRITD